MNAMKLRIREIRGPSAPRVDEFTGTGIEAVGADEVPR